MRPHFLKLYTTFKKKMSSNATTVESFPYLLEFNEHRPLGLVMKRMETPFDLHMVVEVKVGQLAATTQCSAGFAMQGKDLVLGVNGLSIEQFRTEMPKREDDPGTIHAKLLEQLKQRPLRLHMIRLVQMQVINEQYQQPWRREQLSARSHNQFHGHGWLQKLGDSNNDGDEADEQVGMADDEVSFKSYVPLKLKIGVPHPDPVSQATSLASQDPPDITYTLKLPKSMINRGGLSALQLESVSYACQRHNTYLPDNVHRAGFFIGDGAGE
jgi:hypothetical protein